MTGSEPRKLHYDLHLPRGRPEGALVLLHGRGADEKDLVPLWTELDPASRLACVAPRGPLTLPPGGAHWYVVERVGFPHPPTFHHSLHALSDLFDGLPATLGVPLERTVLAGFSQGAVMSYALALGGHARPAGVLAMSGFIPTVDGFELDPAAADGLPVVIAHGSLDPVISVAYAREAAARLMAAGARVEMHETNVTHTIDPGVMPLLRDWVDRVLFA